MSKKEINKNYELRMDLMDILQWAKKKGKRLKPFDFSVRLADFIQRVKKAGYRKSRQEMLKQIEEMALWSKGSVEGTRNDILYQLKHRKLIKLR